MKNLIMLSGENNGVTICINDPCRNIISVMYKDEWSGCVVNTKDGKSYRVRETLEHIFNSLENIRRGLRGEA